MARVIIEGSDKITKARKPHVCTDCGSAIAVGEFYTKETFPVIRGGSPAHIPAKSHCGKCLPRPGVIERKLDREFTKAFTPNRHGEYA